MRVWATWLLAAGLAAGWPNSWAAAPSSQIGSIEQHSEGACSPPIVNNEGQVSISCQTVDEKALRYLESQLSEQFRRLSEQLRSPTRTGQSEISTTSTTICGSRPMTGQTGIASCRRV